MNEKLFLLKAIPCWSFQSVQSLSRVRLFATPWIAARQASLSITNSQSSLKLTSIESVMASSHLILCRPLLLLPPIPPSMSLFQWVNSSHEVAKVLEFQLQHHSLKRNCPPKNNIRKWNQFYYKFIFIILTLLLYQKPRIPIYLLIDQLISENCGENFRE